MSMSSDPISGGLDWRTVFPEEDRRVYEAAGFGTPLEFGARAALLVVDVVESFAGRPGQDVFTSMREYRTSCGPAGSAAVPNMARLIQACREADVPVAYTKGSPTDKFYCGDSIKGTSANEIAWLYGAPIVSSLAPSDGEYVLEKAKASAFFGTPLTSYLQTRGIDTLVVCGTATSGCVRATVVDAFSHGYRVFVVEDCVFDRSSLSHAVSLYEMNAKYASVVPMRTICDRLEEARSR
jgi:maleamate amidohydrolase